MSRRFRSFPADISAFNNDAGYITGYTETDPQYNAWDKDYNDLINKPTIPTVPTNVSEFTNDAGYITTQDIPTIPTVPTNVSAFTNDAGYLTTYTETDPQYNAWNKDYNDLINKPVIPVVPTNVSNFNNDAGYLTTYTETDPQYNAWDKDYNDLINTPVIPSVPENISAFNNDVSYLTAEQQILSISNDTIFLTGGSFVKLPATFSGDYNDLTNKPEIPEIPDIPEIPTVPDIVSAFTNDAGYITMADIQGLLNELSNTIYSLSNKIDSLENLVNNQTPANLDTLDAQPCPGMPTVTDHEGNVYNTVLIGDQCWMRENLRTTTSPSTGIYLIPAVGTGNTCSGKQARWYNNDSTTYAPMNYGLLYNWNAAVDTFNTLYGETSVNNSGASAVSVSFTGHRRGICPAGWHLPNDAEWTQLTNYVISQSQYVCGSESDYNIAKALASIIGWSSSANSCAVGNMPSSNNATGFSAVPAGCYAYGYPNSGFCAYFWSSTEYGDGTCVRDRRLSFKDASVILSLSYKSHSCSVRCLRDEGGSFTVTIPTVTTSAVSNITSTTATCDGEVTADGGATVTVRGVCWSTSQNPTISDAHTSDGTGTGSFTSSITGLTANTIYYARAYATNSAGTAYGNEVSFTTIGGGTPQGGQPCPGHETVTDYDDNTYNTVKIGDQCWMKENLRVTHYADGSAISAGDSNTSNTVPYYYDYSSSNIPLAARGYLYNWPAAMHGAVSSNSDTINVQGICPNGWHLPSDAEWTQLTNYVGNQSEYQCGGSSDNIAKALASTEGWNNNDNNCAVGSNQMVNNATGFSAVPAGACDGSSFYRAGYDAYLWSSSEIGSGLAWFRGLSNDNAYVYWGSYDEPIGFSVRCLRD